MSKYFQVKRVEVVHYYRCWERKDIIDRLIECGATRADLEAMTDAQLIEFLDKAGDSWEWQNYVSIATERNSDVQEDYFEWSLEDDE